ncbi:MAG: hypothetical protein M2R45_01917 [Verrucomicrobia subdivision 3 bacterium]|nr:hypothetical protein [Limisphaerales bacterium]MCS1416216.1 hypothetical protein [Limisphaerales bacterium]
MGLTAGGADVHDPDTAHDVNNGWFAYLNRVAFGLSTARDDLNERQESEHCSDWFGLWR